MTLIGVLDYDIGNLKSVTNAIEYLGYDVRVVTKSTHFGDITHLIIPGVGAFDAAIRSLEASGLKKDILSFAASQRPLLGTCVGMQILATYGYEGAGTNGLNLIAGTVRRFSESEKLMIPHVGWNSVYFQSEKHPLFRKFKKNPTDFYFVNSFYFEPDEDVTSLGKTEYGITFSSVVCKNNVVGVQFHPEKSQNHGLLLLKNFCDWDGKPEC